MANTKEYIDVRKDDVRMGRNTYERLIQQIYDLSKENEILRMDDKGKRPTQFVDLPDNPPYEKVRPDGVTGKFVPDAYFGCASDDAWTCMIKLTKILMKPSDEFYYHIADGYSYSGPTVSPVSCYRGKLKTFKDFNRREVSLIKDFLNEIIPMYNKYFAEVHQTVKFKGLGSEDFVDVDVIYPWSEEYESE